MGGSDKIRGREQADTESLTRHCEERSLQRSNLSPCNVGLLLPRFVYARLSLAQRDGLAMTEKLHVLAGSTPPRSGYSR